MNFLLTRKIYFGGQTRPRNHDNPSSSPRAGSRSPGRDGGREARDASPGLSRTMRESLSVDLSKYIDKEDVKWLVWLAEANISKVGECQENHSTASFINVMEKVYGKVNLSRYMQVLLGAIGKWEAAEKIALTRAAILGVKKQKVDAEDEITLTVKLKASLPQIIRRRNEIENDLRDLVDDDDADVNWDNVSFGGATVRFKMARKYRQRIEMLQDDEWKELGDLPILKYQFQGGEIITVAEDDRHDSKILVSTKYDKRKHKAEAQLLGVVLAQNGIRVLDPLYRQLEVWEDGSFSNAFVDAEAEAKYDLVCADDVEDTESVSSVNDKGVTVVLFSFDKENSETQSSRLIYHLPWMFTMLIEKLRRKPPPPLEPKVPIPVIIETADPPEPSTTAELSQGAVDLQKVQTDVNENVVTLEEPAEDEAERETEESVRCITSAYVHMDNSKRNATDYNDDASIVEAEKITEDAPLEVSGGESLDHGLSDSDENASAAVEVAEESVPDFQNAQLKMDDAKGNKPTSMPISTNEDSDDTKDMMNWTMHKVILIGDSSVGKTSILSRFSDQIFNSNFISTVGIDFKVKKVKRDKRKVKLQIWDTAGQERYRTITAAFYRGTSAFIVVYDVTQMGTFVNVRTWLNQITANTDLGGHVIVLIGNKADLEESRQVPIEVAQQLADELGIKHFETSAKSGDNVTELFHYVADVLPTEDEEFETQNARDTVQLGEEKIPQSRCRC